ncbi:hypothetical protein TWF694_004422 [Orbilia ellipsospora]|uniref:Carboxymuconolactone decarboxylase-like domain-containing protein n=1 Tax=Orbilia ellipsospora TaxID=2528407 RepID=A0AAV9WXM3_9PEZI
MSSRYPMIALDELNPDQKRFHKWLAIEARRFCRGVFTYQNPKTGAMAGIWTHLLYLPRSLGMKYLSVAKALAIVKGLPLRCREVAILAIGEFYGAQFELYAHTRVARKVGLSDSKIQDILEGRPPLGGSEQEIIAWEVARALVGAGSESQKGPLSEELWSRAERAFGKTGAGALIHYSGFYSYTCIILNGTATPVPAGERVWEGCL